MHGVVHGHAPEYVVDMVVPVSHLQADHICDQLNAATSTFHAHGLPSDIDRSLLLLHWPGMNYNKLTSRHHDNCYIQETPQDIIV